MAQINVQNTKITVLDIDNKDYICLTDMAGAKENDVRAADVIKNWLFITPWIDDDLQLFLYCLQSNKNFFLFHQFN